MSTVFEFPQVVAPRQARPDRKLAPSITWTASKQTYYTVCTLVDRGRVSDAYRAYAYFRWVDDQLDLGGLSQPERMAFVERQSLLIERCYRGYWPTHFPEEEGLLIDLIQSDREPDSGLQSYIRYMMAVMAFDAERRDRLISGYELNNYIHWLAVAVTEALHHFICHNSRAPRNELRYQAVAGAHITHMLRDTLEDVEAGYINIPCEVIESGGIDPYDVHSVAYRAWVKQRVELARDCFKAGREYLSQVENLRCRLAGYAYIARFESVLDSIEHDDYRLRATYPECKSLCTALRMSRLSLVQALNYRYPMPVYHHFSATQG